MKLPSRHHPIFHWLAALGAVYLLLLGIGIYRAGEPPTNPFLARHPGMVDLTYALSDTIREATYQKASTNGELSDWLVEQGIPHPSPARTTFVPETQLWYVTNTPVSQQKLQAWLDATYGPEHWRHVSTSTINLKWIQGGRQFGLGGVGMVHVQSNASGEGTHFTRPRPFTSLMYGYNGSVGGVRSLGPFHFTTQYLYYFGPSWPLLLLLVLAPGLFIYLLRRPLSRAMRWRARSNPEQS